MKKSTLYLARIEAMNEGVWRAVNQAILVAIHRQPYLVVNAIFWTGFLLGRS